MNKDKRIKPHMRFCFLLKFLSVRFFLFLFMKSVENTFEKQREEEYSIKSRNNWLRLFLFVCSYRECNPYLSDF